jgi:hypothetical protein
MVAYLRALVLVFVGLAGLVYLIPAAPMTGDGQHYIEFVRNNLQHGASSWHERRLLGPLIVRALPMDAQDGFFVLTTLSVAVTAFLTWLAAREVIDDEIRALASIPLLFGTWVVAPNLREFGLVDPLAWAFVAAIWLATLRQAWLLAAVLGAVGVVAKEIVALAAVAAAAAAFDRSQPWRSVGIAAPSIIVVLLLTVIFPGSGTDAGAYVFDWVRKGLFSNGVGQAIFLLFASYGALWLLVPKGWSALPKHVRHAADIFLIAAILLPLVGSPERMEEAIFPLVVSAALLATRSQNLAIIWAVAVGNMFFVARIGGSARIPSILAWSGLAVACALALWSYVPPGVIGLRRWPRSPSAVRR